MQSPASRIESFPVLDHFFEVHKGDLSAVSEGPNVLNLDANFAEDEWLVNQSHMDPTAIFESYKDAENMRNSKYFTSTPIKALMTPEMVRNRMRLQMSMSASKKPAVRGEQEGRVRTGLAPHDLSARKDKVATANVSPTLTRTPAQPPLSAHVSATESPKATSSTSPSHVQVSMDASLTPVAFRDVTSATKTSVRNGMVSPEACIAGIASTNAAPKGSGKGAAFVVQGVLTPHIPQDDMGTVSMRDVPSARKKELFADEDSFISDDSSVNSHSRSRRNMSAEATTQTIITAASFPIVDVTADGVVSAIVEVSPAQKTNRFSSERAGMCGEGSDDGNDSYEREASAANDPWHSVASDRSRDQSQTPKMKSKSKATPGPLFRHSPGLSPISSSLARDRDAHSSRHSEEVPPGARALGLADASVLNTSPTDDMCPEGGDADNVDASLQSISFINDETTLSYVTTAAPASIREAQPAAANAYAQLPPRTSSMTGRPPLPPAQPQPHTYPLTSLPTSYTVPLAGLSTSSVGLGFRGVVRTYSGSGRVGIFTGASAGVTGLGNSVAGLSTHSSQFWRSRLHQRKKI